VKTMIRILKLGPARIPAFQVALIDAMIVK